MAKGNYTVLYSKDGTTYKLCKILFGSDGSYYVTLPYHRSKEAFLFKATMNYALQETQIPIDVVESASADDDERRIKLSHHPDGFVQFSGHGILSGKDPDGNIRGIGIMSWPLYNPNLGPAFGLSLRHVQNFEHVDRLSGEPCQFAHEDLTPIPGANVLALEGYYFPPLWRRFIQTTTDNKKIISIFHPARPVLRLRVLLPPDSCPLPGFIGLEMYNLFVQKDEEDWVALSSSTGNMRNNEQGHLLGDGLFCLYPRPTVKSIRSLNISGYAMPTTIGGEEQSAPNLQ